MYEFSFGPIEIQLGVELIPNTPEVQADWCERCGHSNDTYFDGKHTLCIRCSKLKFIARKTKEPFFDEGMLLADFLSKLQAWEETYDRYDDKFGAFIRRHVDESSQQTEPEASRGKEKGSTRKTSSLR